VTAGAVTALVIWPWISQAAPVQQADELERVASTGRGEHADAWAGRAGGR